jgi:membrane protein implicated in regulation of membrane protease activity
VENVYIIFWAALAALAFVGELLSVSFFLLFFALGALVGLLLAAFGAGVATQVVGFIGASVLSMLVLRPALLHRISSRTSDPYVGRGSITGKSGVITTTIEPGGNGTVRIGSGEFWTARSLAPGEALEAGTRVRVLDTDGVTALVEALAVEEGEKS